MTTLSEILNEFDERLEEGQFDLLNGGIGNIKSFITSTIEDIINELVSAVPEQKELKCDNSCDRGNPCPHENQFYLGNNSARQLLIAKGNKIKGV